MTETSPLHIEITEEQLMQIRADERRIGRDEGFSDRERLDRLMHEFAVAPQTLQLTLIDAPENVVRKTEEYKALYAEITRLLEDYIPGNRNALEETIRSVDTTRAILNSELNQYRYEVRI